MNGKLQEKTGARSRTQAVKGFIERAVLRAGRLAAGLAAALPQNAAIAAAEFLLGRAVIFGVRPFGTALLCAATRGVPFATAGLILSALTAPADERIMLICISLLTPALRLAVRATVDPPRPGERFIADAFGENLFLRMATASVAAFAAGLWRLIDGGFYYYDLRGAIISMILSPIAVYLFEPALRRGGSATLRGGLHIDTRRLRADTEVRRPRRGIKALLRSEELARELSYAALGFCAVLSLREDALAGISPAHALAMLAGLFFARRRSPLAAALIGLSCGAALGPLWAIAYSVASVAAWTMLRASSPGGAALGALVISLSGLAIDGFDGVLVVLPAALTGMTVFCALDALLAERPRHAESAELPRADADRALIDARERMSELSDAFGELAAAFFELADMRRRPSEPKLRRIADAVSDEFCVGCRDRQRCWELEYDSTLKSFCALAEDAFGREGEKRKTVGSISARCGRLSELSERMRTLASAELRQTLSDDRLSGFACDYRAVSTILSDAAELNRREHTPDAALSEKLKGELEAVGVRCESVTVYGERRLRIELRGADLSHCRLRIRELRRVIERCAGAPLTAPAFVTEDDVSAGTLTLSARRRIGISFGAARGAPDGGVCGDTVSRLENRNELFYVILCDGMGRGDEAAFTAGVCSVFLKRMLAAGNGVEVSLRLLNGIIRRKGGEECTVGVDLLEVDLLTGKACLYKGGAAPTYLRRGDKIYSLASESVPLGIIGELDAGRTELAVEPGDMILMVSDGVISGADESADGGCAWLLDLLAAADPRMPEDVARRALRMARIAGSRDDASAAIIVIGEDGEGEQKH